MQCEVNKIAGVCKATCSRHTVGKRVHSPNFCWKLIPRSTPSVPWHQGSQTNSPWNVDFQNQFPRNPSLWSVHGIPSFLCGRNQSPEELLPANCAVIDSKICLSVSPTQKIPHPKSWGNPLKKGPKRADGPIIGPHSLPVHHSSASGSIG